MVSHLKRLLIINDETDLARLISGTAERRGFATRILRNTLDLEYVVWHFRPDCAAVQMEMAGHQDLRALEFLEQTGYSGAILLTGRAPEGDLNKAADLARLCGLRVTSVLAMPFSSAEVDRAIELLIDLNRAA